MIKKYPELDEKIHSEVLENGLSIYYIPKNGFHKTFAMLAANFGSIDCKFTLDDTNYSIPSGVAHFLEHKMFEEKDGNALQKFNALGAQPNAFTSHTMTAYHFTCTENFYECLEILLRFVTTPYFTDENVAKEKGIIGQEISMLDDTPSWQAYVGVLQGLYENHTVNISIAGSRKTIAPIDPELLNLCHRAFYSPSNLVLTVCGSCDFDRVCDMARRITPKKSDKIASRDYGQEKPQAYKPYQQKHMAVSRPMYMLGFKDTVPEDMYRRQLVGELAAGCICGESTELYEKLYQKKLIDRTFEYEYFTFSGGACIIFSGETSDPNAVSSEIADEIKRMSEQGIEQSIYERAWRRLMGLKLGGTDDPSNICRQQTEAYFEGHDCFDFYEIMYSVSKDEVRECISRWAEDNRSSLMVILPQEQEAENG